jgi:hypothetical protein
MKSVGIIVIAGLSLFMNEQYLHLSTNSLKYKLKTKFNKIYNQKYQNTDYWQDLQFSDLMCFNKIQLLRYSYKNDKLIIDSQSFQFSNRQKEEREFILNDFYIKYPKDFLDKKTPKKSLLKRQDFNKFYKNWFEKQIDILVISNGYKKEKYDYHNNKYTLFKRHSSAIYIEKNSNFQPNYLQYENIHFALDVHNHCYQCATIDYRDSADIYDDYNKMPNKNELSAIFCGGQKIEFR